MDYESLKSVFKKISLIVFLWLLILQFIALCLNTYKWNVFIPSMKFRQLLRLNLITFFYNLIVPGQGAGEVVKVYKMRGTLSIDKVIISVITERVLSLFTALLVCFYGLKFTSYQYPIILEYSVISIIILIILVLWTAISGWIKPFFEWALKVFNFKNTVKANDIFSRFGDNIKNSLTFHSISLNIVLGITAQLLNIFMVLIISNSIGLNISFIDWCWIFSIIGIALILPISFSGIGVREGLFVMLILQLDGSIEDGLVISLSLLAVQLFFALIGWILDLNARIFSKTIK